MYAILSLTILLVAGVVPVRAAALVPEEQYQYPRARRPERPSPEQAEAELRRAAAQAERRPSEELLTALDHIIDRATYRLGPGDRLALNLWGATNKTYDLEVTPEGDLLVPALGPTRVANRTLAEAESLVVASARGSYENTRLTLNLTALRRFRVHVSGRVTNPGAQPATFADRVSTVVESAGELEKDASLRRIRLISKDGTERPVDLEMYYVTGDVSTNPTVEMGDAIVVPARSDSVAVWGAVQIAGYHEYRPGDTVSDMLRLAGGLSDNAGAAEVEWSSFPVDSGPAVMRTVDFAHVLGTPVDRELKPGDRLFVRTLPAWHQRQSVTVEGEVRFPGRYAIVENQTRLSEVLRRAGGLTEGASPRDSRLVREQIERVPDPEYERLSKMLATEMRSEEYAYFKVRSREKRGRAAVDFAKVLARPGGTDDVLLLDRDRIFIAPKNETVEVAGQVNRPGLAPYEAGRTVAFYLNQAGGISWNANRGGLRLIRADTGVWVKPSDDTVLEAGDTIFVPERVPRDWWEIFKEGLLVTSQIATTIFIIQSIRGQ